MTYNVFSGTLNPTHPLAAEINPVVSDILANFNRFRVLAALQYGIL